MNPDVCLLVYVYCTHRNLRVWPLRLTSVPPPTQQLVSAAGKLSDLTGREL